MTFPSWTPEQLAYLALTQCPGFGYRRLQRLWRGSRSWQRARTTSVSDWIRWGIPPPLAERATHWRRSFDLPSWLGTVSDLGIQIVLPDDPQFPPHLSTISDPPTLLFVRGTLPKAPSISLVGTRKPTTYGLSSVRELVPPLCEAGFITVSGLALGIDAEVHLVTLNHHGTTVAFVGNGVDDASLYPSSHLPLAQRIIEQGGAIVSEYGPGIQARKEHFPQRNRLIAGYTLATVVVEAAQESGSLITAKLALEEGHEVFSVPGSIWSKQSEGTNNLIRCGAVLCTSAKDIFDGLQMDRPELSIQAQATLPLDPQEQALWELLEEPLHQDDISRRMETSSAHVSSLITMLELKGSIVSLGGNTWVRSKRGDR